MPPLNEMRLESLKGFEAVENPKASHPPVITPGIGPGANPYIRCPIPPLNSNPDTLRQFNETGKIPTRRVIPLPAQTSGGGVTQTTNTTTIIQQGGGGSSVTPSLTSASVSFDYPSLTADGWYKTQVAMAKSFQLLQVSASGIIEVRLYGSADAQNADIPRETDTAPAFETTQGLISDIVLDSSPFVWKWADRMGANMDSPQTTLVYVTVFSPGEIPTSPGTLAITYLPLEN